VFLALFGGRRKPTKRPKKGLLGGFWGTLWRDSEGARKGRKACLRVGLESWGGGF